MIKLQSLLDFKDTVGKKFYVDFSGIPFFNKIMNLQKDAITIGVDVGFNHIRLLKTKKLSNNTWEVLDHKSISYLSQDHKGTPAFENILKSEMNNFCGTERKLNIWVSISSAGVNIRNIEIPNVQKRHIEKTVYWAIKKENIYDEKESILDFEVRGVVKSNNTSRLSVMVYTVPKHAVDEIKTLFFRIGMPLTGITFIPFSFQNILRTGWIPNLEKTIAHLFIGNDFSRIDIYSENNLVLSRNIKTGIKSKIESVLQDIKSGKHLADLSERKDIQIDEGSIRKLISSLSKESSPLEEPDFGFGMDDKEIFEMILPVLKRLVRQLEATFEYYEKNVATPKVEKIYLSTVINLSEQVIDYISKQCGIKTGLLDPLSSVISCGVNEEDTKCVSDRTALMPALGVAMSARERTPNLLCTYRDRKHELLVNRVSQAILVVFFVAVGVCACISVFQSHIVVKKKVMIAGIERQLSSYNPRLSKEMIEAMVSKIQAKQQLSKKYSERYLGMAVIEELSAITPDYVRFISISANFGIFSSEVKNKTYSISSKDVKGQKGEVKRLVVNGIALGDRSTIETALFDYAMKLRSSPMFSHIDVQKIKFVNLKKESALQFVLTIEIKV